MTDYRRFVVYVYEYQKEKKGCNCGFVKVEVRGRICRMELHLQCQGLMPGNECKIYGFVRNKGLLDGVILGKCRTGENHVECVLETQAANMGDSGKSLDEMAGMIFITEQGGFFGTEWDDQMIRPGDFRATEKKTDQKTQEEEKRTAKSQNKDTQNQEPQNIDAQNQNPPAQEETGEKPEPEERPESEKESKPEKEPDPEKEPELQSQSVRESPPLPGTPCDIFTDGELTDCRKISLQELCRLGRRACMLRNNRFVQYGSYNFGHLLLCRNRCGQLILGVPGGYDQQERFMANMFGFPYFKESRHIQIPGGKGGYWYRLIDSPDSNNRNGCQ